MTWGYRIFLFFLGAMMGGALFVLGSLTGSPHP